MVWKGTDNGSNESGLNELFQGFEALLAVQKALDQCALAQREGKPHQEDERCVLSME